MLVFDLLFANRNALRAEFWFEKGHCEVSWLVRRDSDMTDATFVHLLAAHCSADARRSRSSDQDDQNEPAGRLGEQRCLLRNPNTLQASLFLG